jgi:hypothetical protein
MSLIDFTANLFRDQERARAFADNPVQALRDAGLPDVTPADVAALLPTVAESMPPDHPLQSLVRPAQPLLDTEPVEPNVRHYYQLQPGDQVIDGVAGQTILRPDGTNVTLDTNDVILQPDEKVYVMQPGDQAIPGINGMVVQHPDGSITDVGIDTTIVHEDEVCVGDSDPRVTTTAEDLGGGLDPRVTTTAEDLGGGLDPRVTTTAEDLGGGLDPRVTTTAEDLGESDTSWTPYEEAMDVMVCPPEEPEISYDHPDSYSADQSGYDSASATQSTAGPDIIG